MDGNAWAGWAAVKIAAEAALRTGSNDPVKLLGFLESPTSQFDGHKGWPLTFRIADHQLRQPLYVVSRDTSAGSHQLLRDVPELRATSSASSSPDVRRTSQVLDRLISGPTVPRCPWIAR
jgi:hypothetical protein